MSFKFSLLSASQANDAHGLLMTSFDARMHPFISMCQPEAAAYLTGLLSIPRWLRGPQLYSAATRHGALCGFAEFSVLADGRDHLNYIAVSPDFRGRGIGTSLIRHRQGDLRGSRDLTLNVFSDNVAAISLYRALGLTAESESRWVTRPLDAPKAEDGSEVVAFVDPLASLAHLRLYGFGRFRAEVASESLGMTAVSKTVVRMPLLDRALAVKCEQALVNLVPTLTRVMNVVPNHLPIEGEQVATSIFMSGKVRASS